MEEPIRVDYNTLYLDKRSAEGPSSKPRLDFNNLNSFLAEKTQCLIILPQISLSLLLMNMRHVLRQE